MKKFKILIIALTALFISGSVSLVTANKPDSSLPHFKFPIKCQLSTDCWISEYPDVDMSTDWHDYTGGKRTVNSHLGTDIIIKDIGKMKEGVPVVAAASGIVTATRDGIDDINVKEIGASTVDKIGCGNAAVINIGNGWTNIYCHMRKGSVAVKKGDQVLAGQKLGLVGMSGLAETPHLHFQVQHFKDTIDPFTGNSLNSDEKINESLWESSTLKQIKYYPAFIYNIGVIDKSPNTMDLQSGKINPVRITSDTPDLFLWADIFGLDKGDYVQFIVKNSGGKNIIDERMVLDKSNVRRFFYLRHKSGDLKPGIYNAAVKLHKSNFECSKYIAFRVT